MANVARCFRTRALTAVALAVVLGGCGTDLTLPPASIPIAQQQITLYALTGTPVGTPSAYDQISLTEVRTDVSSAFDFAFDLRFDSAYGLGHPGDTVAVLLPRGALGFSSDPGLQQIPTLPWDSVRIAPTDGYINNKAVRIRAGDILYSASRIQTCNYGFDLPHYAKLLIQQIDLANRVATILVIADPNCGYRELGSGIPNQ
jgi:hypothetical protein